MVVAHVTPDGRWRFPVDLEPESLTAAPPFPVDVAVRHLVRLGVDVAVPQMFCVPGMTTYRSLLDLLAIPYLGNRADTMALGAHKARTRAVVAEAGVWVPRAEVLRLGEQPNTEVPAVVEPVDAENSDGVSLVREPADFGPALTAALEHSDEVLVEAYVEAGREVRCGVLERDGVLTCLPLEEYAVDPIDKPVRSRADKLRREPDGDLRLVAKDAEHAQMVDVDDPATEPVWSAAWAAHAALGCRDYGLFDFRIDPDGTPWFLEAGLYCSFAEQSVVVMMARAAGIPLPTLFADLVAQAVRRG